MKKIGKEQVRKARQTLAKYKEGKAVLDKRIVSNEQWWKLRHWGEIGYDKDDTRPMPASAWLFNSLANKHADAMDNIPEPAVLPREKSDEEVAKQLSLILPGTSPPGCHTPSSGRNLNILYLAPISFL